MVEIKRLDTRQTDFREALGRLRAYDDELDMRVERAVREILDLVRKQGDRAVVDYTNQFDGLGAESVADLVISPRRLQAAAEALPGEQRTALETAAERLRTYHEHQRMESWRYTEPDGTVLGQKVTALDRAGLYVPGGKAAYPSSVLMNAIPAKVAGVGELIMTVPTPGGEVSDLVLAAAHVAGVDRVFAAGGAQAVGALAYGTESIPAVDKIVGPGNIYVATAKRLVFGTVGIDMIAGPSEVLIIADETAHPDWLAMDLFAQAEHDEQAQALLVTPSGDLIDQVVASVSSLLDGMDRAEIIRNALRARGGLIQVQDLSEAAEVANQLAPEHLELAVGDPEGLLSEIRHAGAIFLGHHSAEALGDYCAGPNHVLPTGRTARFSSPLGVYDFQKRSSLIYCSPVGAAALSGSASVLARGEGLTAHARSAELRAASPASDRSSTGG